MIQSGKLNSSKYLYMQYNVYDINTKICSQPKEHEKIFCLSSRPKKSNQLHRFTQAVIFYELTLFNIKQLCLMNKTP